MAPGEKHFRLTSVGFSGSRNKYGCKLWLFKCDCGTDQIAIPGDVRTGRVRSCGCLKLDVLKERTTTHDATHSKEYAAWVNMKSRCKYGFAQNGKRYVERGIKVCEEWDRDFVAFFNHIGPRPSPQHSVDRIDNDRGYEPGNVRWATRTTQQNNKSSNRIVEFRGQRMTMTQACRLAGLNVQTVFTRLNKGISFEQALR